MAKNNNLTMMERLEEKIVRVPWSGCWIWIGSMFAKGYGQTWKNNKHAYAHRVMYELLRGPVPDGLELDHLCRVPCCINPDHLEAVTHRENILRGEGYMAKLARQTHCLRGHIFDNTNTRIYRNRRVCRACESKAKSR